MHLLYMQIEWLIDTTFSSDIKWTFIKYFQRIQFYFQNNNFVDEIPGAVYSSEKIIKLEIIFYLIFILCV